MVRRQAALLTVGLLLLAAVAMLVAPLTPGPSTLPQLRVATYAYGFAFLAVVTAFAWAAAGLLAPLRTRVLAAALLVLAAVAMALNVFDVDVVSDVVKIAFGVTAGIALARAVERPWWLVPILVCVPIADAWSVFSENGVSNAVIERAADDPAWIDWPTIALPVAGFGYDDWGRLGIVDVLFMSLMLAVVLRWAMGARRALVVLPAAIMVTTAVTLELEPGRLSALPALPVLCLAFLLAWAVPLWRDLQLELRSSRGGPDG